MAGTQLSTGRGRDFAPAEIDKALTTLAYYGGNSARASQELGINDRTLRLWRSTTHRERYLEIAEREAPRLEAIAAHQARELIMRAGEAEHDLLSLLTDSIDQARAPKPQRDAYEDDDEYEAAIKTWTQRPNPKELGEIAGTLQRTTTSKGINGTKLLELTGRPTQIVEHRDPKQDAIALAKQLGLTWTSTAVEEPITDVPLQPESSDDNARGTTVQPDRTS